jgi:hypothetical protein
MGTVPNSITSFPWCTKSQWEDRMLTPRERKTRMARMWSQSAAVFRVKRTFWE